MEIEDMIGEILVRLPVKSLMRCRCLSKKWNNYICFNSYFRRRYLSVLNCSPSMLGFFCNNGTSVEFIPTCDEASKYSFQPSLDFLGHQTVYVVASSNGFLLCCLEKWNPVNYYVCNPITKKWVALPTPTNTAVYVSTGFICHGTHTCPDMVTYKVVRGMCMSRRGFFTTLTFEIFSSDSFSWQVFSLTCPTPFHLVWQRGHAIVDEQGVIHWLALTQNFHPGVVVFDPREENLQFVQVPGDVHGNDQWLTESGGQILLSQKYMVDLEIWVLRVGSNSKREWTLKCRVNLETMGAKFPDLRTLYGSIVGGHPHNSEVLFVSATEGLVTKILSYDMEKSKLDFVCDLVDINFLLNGFYSPFICSTNIPLIRLWDTSK